MTLIVFVGIVAIATLFLCLGWRRAGQAGYGIAAVLFLAVGCGPVPAWLLGQLQSAYATRPMVQWAERNAIVLLGAGTALIPGSPGVEPGFFAYPRLVEAAMLYRGCRATQADCKIIVSGGDPQYHGMPEASVYRAALVDVGIPASDILAEAESRNTWQNAQFTSAMLADYRANRVVLVSSALHLRRSLMYFAHFGIAPVPVRADYPQAVRSWLPLSFNFTLADFALHEFIGIARYHFYNGMGWNVARTQPGQA
ncbi:hypothetical protein CAL12_05850 [Bordetella genomosp. 8]|uniref:DUF218 domain-containing protein n=1 Tax=Bordetella genomosp. 8 TaxID=1416806 RepID=A0A1W6YIL6_9BORD|nr:YdcF family protein [Bordetella genomosp. 8]ARP80403.1 hypothetical protein CAL12_05850 [Bordetella genomosp. 8]